MLIVHQLSAAFVERFEIPMPSSNFKIQYWFIYWQPSWFQFPLATLISIDMCFYPVHGAKSTLIQPAFSAHPCPLVFLIWYPYSLVFFIWLMLQTIKVNAIVLNTGLLRAAMDTALSQGLLLWCHNKRACYCFMEWDQTGWKTQLLPGNMISLR